MQWTCTILVDAIIILCILDPKDINLTNPSSYVSVYCIHTVKTITFNIVAALILVASILKSQSLYNYYSVSISQDL